MGNSSCSIRDQVFPLIMRERNAEEIKKLPGLKITTTGITFVEIEPIMKTSFDIIIYSHGNAIDIYETYYSMVELADMTGKKVIVYDYPSYGLSTGICTEDSTIDSLADIVQFYNNIILIGESIGTGVVLGYLSKYKNDKIKKVVLISPFLSIPKIVCESWWLELFFDASGGDSFRSYSRIDNVKVPIIIFHGSCDKLIPVSHSRRLSSLNKNCIFYIIEGAGHNDIFRKIDFRDI